MSNTITAIILTKDEEKHIARCIKSLTPFVNEIWVIGSFSTDKTLEIAEELGAKAVWLRKIWRRMVYTKVILR